ncbi:type II secretion system F family protein [Jatrophihabitans sp.]|jgi:Flp pilus assembly protein TadB|uniref:type II secretion system F family protein n=1 Tax=Jatrophihabitans sp. TaxID=1932789 RepID=UPI002EE42D48
MSALGWAALAGALALIPARRGRTPARHRNPPPGVVPPAARPVNGTGSKLTLPLLAAIATAVLAVLLGGWRAAVLAPPLAVGVGWLVAKRPSATAAARSPEARSVAFVVDLLAGVLAAGSPPELAIERVAAAVTEHGSNSVRHAVEPLARVGRLLQLGSEPAAAWGSLHPVPGYGPVADSGRRCAASGARLAGALAAVAADLRARHQAEALARAERVGVWSLLPLGLCFLPAFVCLGVLPVILGVADEVFSGVPT